MQGVEGVAITCQPSSSLLLARQPSPASFQSRGEYLPAYASSKGVVVCVGREGRRGRSAGSSAEAVRGREAYCPVRMRERQPQSATSRWGGQRQQASL